MIDRKFQGDLPGQIINRRIVHVVFHRTQNVAPGDRLWLRRTLQMGCQDVKRVVFYSQVRVKAGLGKNAKGYEVSGSTVVVVRKRNGKVDSFKRLDEVWTLVDKEPEFRAYVTQEINSYLGEENYDDSSGLILFPDDSF